MRKQTWKRGTIANGYITTEIKKGKTNICSFEYNNQAFRTREANAKLIEAAPKLHEALERIIGYAKPMTKDCSQEKKSDYRFALKILSNLK